MTAEKQTGGAALSSHEVEVLKMLAGTRDGEWGAWVSACLEFLEEGGYCTRGPKYRITQKGRAYLAVCQPQETKDE